LVSTDLPQTSALPISFSWLGPFYAWQRRVGLVSAASLKVGRRAVLFVALAWLPRVAAGAAARAGPGWRR
jgi:hypothetical protein